MGRTHAPRRSLDLDELAALMRLAQTTATDTDEQSEDAYDDDRE